MTRVGRFKILIIDGEWIKKDDFEYRNHLFFCIDAFLNKDYALKPKYLFVLLNEISCAI